MRLMHAAIIAALVLGLSACGKKQVKPDEQGHMQPALATAWST